MTPEQINDWRLFELLLRVIAEQKQDLETRKRIIEYVRSRKSSLLSPSASNKLLAQMENGTFDDRAKHMFCELLNCVAEPRNLF